MTNLTIAIFVTYSGTVVMMVKPREPAMPTVVADVEAEPMFGLPESFDDVRVQTPEEAMAEIDAAFDFLDARARQRDMEMQRLVDERDAALVADPEVDPDQLQEGC
jgi:hypothetical protein